MQNDFTEPTVISCTEDKFEKEIVPGVCMMKHTFGNDMSVALYKITKGEGGKFPKVYHHHGEEVGIQLKGSSTVWASGKEYKINEGEAIFIPGGLDHAGIFGDEEGWLLAICAPPRDDYGPANWDPIREGKEIED